MKKKKSLLEKKRVKAMLQAHSLAHGAQQHSLTVQPQIRTFTPS